MFYQDFQVVQGVLAVDATSFTIANMLGLLSVGDGLLQKVNQSTPTLSIETFPGDVHWSRPQHQLNQIFTTGVVNPGDIDVPKPPK